MEARSTEERYGRRTSIEVYELLGEQFMEHVIRSKRLQLLGHIESIPKNRWSKKWRGVRAENQGYDENKKCRKV